MIRLKIFSALILMLIVVDCHAQKNLNNRQYATKYGDMAREQMQKYGIPASVTLAQGILESGCGASRLAVEANNHFGIKCGSSWSGATISHDDDRSGECFRRYSSVEESYVDHSLFLINGSRYSGLFRLESTDYEGWSRGLSLAGYATDPRYADLLIGIIEREKLWKYDLASGGQMEPELYDDVASGGSYEHNGLIYGELNGVDYLVVIHDQSLSTLSKQVGVSVAKLLKYNDLDFTVPLYEGMAVYLSPKKSKSGSFASCMVQSGDNMHSISQQYGIKLTSLYRMNHKYRYTQPKVGDIIRLR